MKVFNYLFIQVNNNYKNGDKVDVDGMSQILQIYYISVDENAFEDNFTKIIN